MNNITDKKINNCSGCQVCAAICHYEAISIRLDTHGFYMPIVDNEKCAECGMCKKVCYKFDDDVKMSDEYQNVWACRSNDVKILQTVTSGGVAYLLAVLGLNLGYKVVGVTYDNDHDIAVAKATDNNAEQFKGSKYIQAYTEKAFKEIIKKEDNSKYLVFGTPCHIYALDKATKLLGKREKFIFVDLFCHGCPSMLLWQKSVDKAKKILNKDKFDNVEFRSKKRGWHEFVLNFEAKQDRYLTKNEFDGFFQIFFSDIVLNDACNDCKLRRTLNYTDIRLGDFWGDKYDLDSKGVSAVVAVSAKGKDLILKLPKEIFISEHSLADVIKFQSYTQEYNVNTTVRNKVFELLKSEKNIDEMIAEYNKMLSMKLKIKSVIKKTSYILPRSIRYFVRKIIHSK